MALTIEQKAANAAERAAKKLLQPSEQPMVVKEIIVLSKEDISELRRSAGQKATKIANSAMVFSSTPKSGVFERVGTKVFDIPNVGVRIAVGLYTNDGEFVSENSIIAQQLLDKFSQIKNGLRKDRYALKSEKMSDISDFGKSADERLFNMVGKSFTTEKVKDCRVYKSAAMEKFDDVCFTHNTESNLTLALASTEAKDLYIFTVVK